MSDHNNIHFIACGGAVMHNLALALHHKGITVTGSDDEVYNPAKDRLKAVGILPEEFGWFPEKITTELDAVILGMHARKDNPELLKAQELGIKIYSFPEYVFEHCRDKQRIVIAGSHGKTTITSIILHVLKHYNRKFDFLVGAQIDGFDVMVQLTDDAPIIIIEGDEYLSSAIEMKPKFLFYHPHELLMSGIAWDHFNVFPKFEDYVKAFEELVDGLPKAGSFIFDQTDDIVNVIGNKEREGVQKFPYDAHPYEVKNGTVHLIEGTEKHEIKLFGKHNMKNLAGAKIVLERVGINAEMFYEAIKSFSGASKRLEKLSENKQTAIYRDFAHAPSKVKATTDAAAELFENRNLVACYELHTYSSLNKDFLPQYSEALDAADVPVVFYSPHTLEMKKMPAISSDEIKAAFENEAIQIFTDRSELENFLKSQNWYQSNLLLMSSGTFGGMDFQGFSKEILDLPVTVEKAEKKGTMLGRLFKKKK